MKNDFKLLFFVMIFMLVFTSSGLSADEDTLIFLSAENFIGRWNPTAHTTNSHVRLQEHIGETLVTVDEDNNLLPRLAVSWENIDPYTWEFKLRQGVEFHDGTKLTANDVKATIEYYTRPEAATSGYWPEQLSVEVIDDHTVRIKTEKFKAGSVLFTLAGYPPIFPASNVENPEIWDEKLVGTGPWVFDKYKNDAVYMKANDNYWGEKPKIENFIFKYVAEPESRLTALMTGEAHIIDRVETEQIPRIETGDRTKIETVLTGEHVWIHFRNEREPFKDNPALRKAIAYAIDREGIVEHILQGSGAVPDSFISPKQFGYLGEHPDNPKQNLEKAKELLIEAGYPGGKGLEELEFIIPKGFYPKTQEYGQYITSTLNNLGISVQLTPEETAAWNQRLYERNEGHMIICGWMPGTPEPDYVLHSMFRSPGRINFIEDDEIENILLKEMQIVNVDEREKFIHNEVNALLLDKMPSYPIHVSELIMGTTKNLKNWKLMHTGNFYVDEAYFE